MTQQPAKRTRKNVDQESSVVVQQISPYQGPNGSLDVIDPELEMTATLSLAAESLADEETAGAIAPATEEEAQTVGFAPEEAAVVANLAPLEEIEPAVEAKAEEPSPPETPAGVAPGFFVPCAVVARPVPEQCDLSDPSLYFNQELSWLDFNWRVLWLALDERTPLLERVRFAAITASNLDEFYQKRVGGLKRQRAAGVRKLTPDGRTPEEQDDRG